MMSLLLPLSASPYPMEQVKAIPQPKYPHPLCTFPVSATSFELPIKRNRRMIEFSENGTLCFDLRLKTLPGFDRKGVNHFGDLTVQSVCVFD